MPSKRPPAAVAKPAAAKPSGRTGNARLSPAEREKRIVEGAIAYFAEVGFAGRTRELSRRLGITQPLLYRYFPSKQALAERVYRTMFEGRWNPAWVSLIRDRARPLRERLIEFYRQYSAATYRPEWIRIYMHAALEGTGLNRRYIGMIERDFLSVMCLELRAHAGAQAVGTPVAPAEIEFAWNLHGAMFYYAVRHHVYRTAMTVDFMDNAAFAVDSFLAGVKRVYPNLLAAPSHPNPVSRRASAI